MKGVRATGLFNKLKVDPVTPTLFLAACRRGRGSASNTAPGWNSPPNEQLAVGAISRMSTSWKFTGFRDAMGPPGTMLTPPPSPPKSAGPNGECPADPCV
jgi:hypothetical protein